MSLTFQILSDLHVDFSENFNFCIDSIFPTADILIVAGDTCSFKAKCRKKINKKFFSRWKMVIEIPGNHDYYFHQSAWIGKNKSAEINDNHYYLDNSYIDVEKTRIICSTLWSYIYPENAFHITYSINDYRVIHGYTVEKNNQRHKESKEFLASCLQALPDDMSCIVVTHHVPLRCLISPRYAGNKLNDAFVSETNLITTVFNNRIKYWIHGHTHDPMIKTVGNIDFIRNPLGYIIHDEHLNFNRQLNIKI